MNCIYLLYCDLDENKHSYIGYCKNLKTRKANHSCRVRDPSINYPLYQTIREIGYDHFKYEVLHSLPTYDRKLLKQLEKVYFNLYKPNLNKIVPLRTAEEYHKDNVHKQQYQRLKNRVKNNEIMLKRNRQHKEQIKKTAREHYLKNKEKIHSEMRSKRNCICGCVVTKGHFKKHCKSIIHSERLNNIFNNEVKLIN